MRNRMIINLTAFAAALIITASVVNAQGVENASYIENSVENLDVKTKLDGTAVANLINGIKSDNPGVRKYSIYYAGKYRVKETVDALVESLGNEKDPNIRHLTAVVLYIIGDDEGIAEVVDLAKFDNDPRVRRLAAAIYKEYIMLEQEIALSK